MMLDEIRQLWLDTVADLPDVLYAHCGDRTAQRKALHARLGPALEALAQMCGESSGERGALPFAADAAALLCSMAAGAVEQVDQICRDAEAIMCGGELPPLPDELH